MDGMEDKTTSTPNSVHHYVVDKVLLWSGIFLSNCNPMLPTIKVRDDRWTNLYWETGDINRKQSNNFLFLKSYDNVKITRKKLP